MPTQVPTLSQSLEDWLTFILAVHPSEIEMGLPRVRQVAENMGLLQLPESTIITVAGTNGKGSTCAMMESILLAGDFSVGVFSSPHLHRYNERVRINREELEDRDHIEAFSAINEARGDIQLTFFEYSTLGALYLFAKYRPQVVLLEVGLGGRLDATNIIDAHMAVITSIDLDHQEYLGNTREAVGREKAGVMRPQCFAIIGEPSPPQSLLDYGNKIDAGLLLVGEDFSGVFFEDSWQFDGQFRTLSNLPIPRLPKANAITALAALECYFPSLTDVQIRQGLQQAQLAGRMQWLADNVVTDVAHNPHACRHLAQQLAQIKAKRQGKVWAVCAMLEDKDIESSLAPLLSVVDHWLPAALSVPRGSDGNRIQQQTAASACYGDVAEAIETAKSQAGELDLVIVFGSFYTVAQAQSAVLGES